MPPLLLVVSAPSVRLAAGPTRGPGVGPLPGLALHGRLALLTQIPTRSRLPRLVPLAHLDGDPPTPEVHTLHLLLRAQGVLVQLVLGKPVAPRLLGLGPAAAIRGRVGLVDDVAVFQLAELLEGRDQLFLGEALVDVPDVEAGVWVGEGVLSSSSAWGARLRSSPLWERSLERECDRESLDSLCAIS